MTMLDKTAKASIWICPAGQHVCEKYSVCQHRPEDRTGYVCDGPIRSSADPRPTSQFLEAPHAPATR